MAFATNNVRVTIGGTAFGGAEIWSTGFYLGKEAAPSEDPTQAAADAIRALWETFFTTAASGGIHNNFTTTYVKLARLDLNGRAEDGKTVWANVQTPMVGGNNTSPQPPQIAAVATLTSNELRGWASKGRMYLPGPATAVDSTGHMATTARDSFADRLKIFFDGVKASASIPDDPILASQGNAGVPGSPRNRLMTGLRVGNVLDTQRRRRNQLAEVYAIRTLA